jgi:heptosyltransferase-2
MALPAIAAVRAKHASASLTIAAQPSVAPLFAELTPAAPDAVLTIADQGGEAALLASGRFDAILLLTNSFRTAWVARRARIPERWGHAGNLRGWLLTRAATPPRGVIHQSRYYNGLVETLGIGMPQGLPSIRPRERSRAKAAELLATERVSTGALLVGIAPGAAYGHAKRWPPARMAEVVGRLSRDCGAVCVLVGAAGDRGAGREIESALPPDIHVVNLIGRTDLGALIGLLERCRAFVSNDSGAMHLAAAAGVPVVAIFGPTDERATAPLGDHDVLVHHVFCRPCMLRDCPIDHRCMNGITVDSVFGAVSKTLDAGRPERSGP